VSASHTAEPGLGRRRQRGILIAVAVVALAGAALAVLSQAGTRIHIGLPFGRGGQVQGQVIDNATATSLATVTRRALSSQVAVNGSMGYTGSYGIVNQARGTVTALPAVGQVVVQGQPLYAVDGHPVVLLYGSVPAYRSLSEGMSGADVSELNADLVALGETTTAALDPTSDYFSWATAVALGRLQAALGVDRTDNLALGQAVFAPSAARITAVSATLGGQAPPGGSILQASSTSRQIVVQLNAAEQSEVQVGDHVTITLPSNKTTQGTVSQVGTVAATPAASAGSSDATPKIEVDITPSDPAATGSLDQAPVEVSITTASVSDALVVPVAALLALADGGYAVETVDAHHVHHLVPVNVGIFDDAEGLVQVTGAGLLPGQSVVVPSS
jgi:hypothetical protein